MSATLPPAFKEIPDASATRRPIAPALSRIVPWLLFATLLAVQFALFRQYALREITWAYPQNFDQAVFLDRSYETYDRMIHQGFVAGLMHGAGFRGGAPVPNGALIHLQAAILFRVLGPGRLAALTLNFLYFALFQFVLAQTVRFLSGSWARAFISLAFLLTAGTTFQDTGGIMDFRIDFITFCLFGIFICLVLRAGIFASLGWSLAAGLVASYTIAFRFITLAYFLPIFLLMFAVLAWDVMRHRTQANRKADAVRRLRNLLAAGVLAVITAGPVLIHHWSAIDNYYLRLHAAGQQRYIRASMFKVADLRGALAFYPHSVATHHAGYVFLGFAAILVILGATMGRKSAVSTNPSAPRYAAGPAFGFVLACLLIPLAALTCDVDKNAAVGSILVGPLLWLAVLAALRVQIPPDDKVRGRAVIGMAGASLALAMTMQCIFYRRHSDFTRHRSEVTSVLDLYERIGALARAHRWESPAIANDSFADYLFPSAINVMTYERHGYLLHAHETLATDVVAKPPREIVNCLERCDFALITRRLPPKRIGSPFDQSIELASAQSDAYCKENLARVKEIRAMEREITLFARP
ncbi:MAG: hypothetical protein JWN24_3253 [Phycisphaerales bacterium]|nr:hypothetical protein [Phycisphaerales bacterium]